jgi:hypothetical protein
LCFGLRISESGEWIDQVLSGTLASLVSPAIQTNPLVAHFVRLTSYFLEWPRQPAFAQLHRDVEFLKDNLPPAHNLPVLRLLSDRCTRVLAAIAGDRSQITDRVERSRFLDIGTELGKLRLRTSQAKKICAQLHREFLCQRQSALVSAAPVYRRDPARCFAFCTPRLHPKRSLRSWPVWELTTGVATQTEDTPRSDKTAGLGEIFACRWVRPFKTLDARLWFPPRELAISISGSDIPFYVPFDDIANVLPRRYFQLNTAVELLLRDGTAYFLDFAPTENTEILGFFGSCACEWLSVKSLTRQWFDSRISTFFYLMNLNIVGGRSFEDEMQWPVLPNLLFDRDLAVPVKQFFSEWDFPVDSLFCESILTPPDLRRLLFRLEPFASRHIAEAGDAASALSDLARTELPAEFFFEPEVFSLNTTLDFAPFALSAKPFDFVYGLRKQLESDSVSARIHLWIDSVFGHRQQGAAARAIGNTFHPCLTTGVHTRPPDPHLRPVMRLFGVMPAQLFSDPHPARAPRPAAQTGAAFAHTLTAAPLAFAGRLRDGALWLVDTAGRLSAVRVDLALPARHEPRACPDAALPPGGAFALAGGGLLAYDAGGKMQFVGQKGRFESEMLGINEFVGAGVKFVTVRNRTVLHLYDVRSFPERAAAAASTEDVIECIGVSEGFHLLCVITRDDRLHFFSLKGLAQIKAVKLPRPSARRVIVTPAWGFVAVDFGREIVVFSINGEMLVEYTHSCQFAYLTAIRSPKDFDYFVYSDVKGNLVICEAYRPENRAQLAQLVWPVCLVVYEEESDCLVVVGTTGKVMLITHPFVNLSE